MIMKKKFPLADNLSQDIKVIIGEQPYKQCLNGIRFAVDGSLSTIPIYQKTKNISFLVSNWIKVQDSLEMIFNLLFGHKRSLYALADLRKLQISPIKFAEFLWSEAKLILLNRNIEGIDYGDEIRDFINHETQHSTAHILFVGEKAAKNFPTLSCKNKTAMAIHPSGNNLNKKKSQRTTTISRHRYYNDWIDCNGETLVDSTGLCLTTFRLFK
jgi:hypothetical protein